MSIQATTRIARPERRNRAIAPRMATLALCPALGLALSACTATKSGQTISAPRAIEASQAMIVPAPGGPMVLSLIEERFSNGVEQKVILGTDATNSGQNYMSVRLFGPMERETRGTKSLPYRSVTAISMNNEAIFAMPGMPMKASTLFLRNNYGPFGYSFGQNSRGDSCIYGWQQLRSSDQQRQAFRNAGAIQIRVRLCENGASERQLLAVMYGYTVTGSFASDQWNPYGPAKDVPAMNVSGQPIFPNDSELADAKEIARPAPVRRKRVVIAKPTGPSDAQVEQDNIEAEDDAKRIVDVPSPGDTDSAPDDDNATPDATPDSSVTVPGPG